MNLTQTPSAAEEEALVAICLFAAFSDGDKSEAEQLHLGRLDEDMSENLTAQVSNKILAGRLSLKDAAQTLATSPHRDLAYEMAVGVCEADGSITTVERAFLNELSAFLALAETDAQTIEKPVAEVALAPIGEQPTSAAPQNQGMILRYAILNGALELLPDTFATLSIVPLQIKMVYRIGKSHGVSLDTGHIKEFITTAGLGLTSQVVEGFARKFAKGLAGKFAGKLGGKIAQQGTGTAFSFASTYAIGLLAEKYYASGRTLSSTQLRADFPSLLSKGKDLYANVQPQIQERSKNLTPGSLVSLLRDPSAV